MFPFQCHPTNQSGGAIYDWMNVKFIDNTICPCRLAAVVVMDEDPSNPECYCMVIQAAIEHSCVDLVLITEWTCWSSKYYAISTNLIDSPCFVISIKDDGS